MRALQAEGSCPLSAQHGTHFFWSDWLGDQAVRRLTPAERGVWIDLLALASVGNPTGYVCDEKGRALSLDEIGRVTGAAPEQVSELINGILEKGAASRDRTGRLFNRRMVRDAQKARAREALKAKRASAGYAGAESTALKYFGKQILPRHGPRQLSRHSLVSIPNHKTTSSLSVTGLKTPSEPVDKPQAFEGEQGEKPISQQRAEEIMQARKRGIS